jgi:hypothetical protein
MQPSVGKVHGGRLRFLTGKEDSMLRSEDLGTDHRVPEIHQRERGHERSHVQHGDISVRKRLDSGASSRVWIGVPTAT